MGVLFPLLGLRDLGNEPGASLSKSLAKRVHRSQVEQVDPIGQLVCAGRRRLEALARVRQARLERLH